MLILSYIQTADSTLPVGRFDSALLSDQELLEILVSNFEDKALESFREPTGDYMPVCDWLGVQCDFLENITAIDWEDWDGVHSEISLDLLPKKIKKLRMGKFLSAYDAPRLSGTLSTALLPTEICVLDIEDQNFNGPVDFTSFPAKVAKVNISQNKFSGKAEFHAQS